MRAITIAVFLGFAALLVLLDLLGRARVAHIPPAAQLFRWMLRKRSTQLGILIAWWWIGWHFLGDFNH